MTKPKPFLNGTNGHAKAQRWADHQQRKAKALDVVEQRPKVRGDCVDGERPCSWVSCKHHLLTDRLHRMSNDEALDELDVMPETCTLDVADRGGASLQDVAEYIGTSERHIIAAEQRAFAAIRSDYDRSDFDEPSEREDMTGQHLDNGADALADVTAILRSRARGK
jgi:hypothetical protein